MSRDSTTDARRLYLVRHAKSSWHDSTLDDAERPLNKRGRRDAPMMGKRLANAGYVPDLIVTSPANRAFTTARTIAREVGYPRAHIVRDDDLYLCNVDTLLRIVRATDRGVASLMLFGHNPGFTDFANELSDQRVDNVPTCGMFCVDFVVGDWSEAAPGIGHFVAFDYPKRIVDPG